MIELPKTKTGRVAVLCRFGLLAAVTIASLIPRMSPPGEGIELDKILHAVSFVLLAGIPLWALPGRKNAVLIAHSVAPYGYLLEFLQKTVPGREFTPEDLLANNIGAAIRIKRKSFLDFGGQP